MANIFFYSDPHFSHPGICKFLRDDGTKLRPFDDVAEMDEVLIQNINAVVRPQDKLYCLGDLLFKDDQLKIMERINCRHMRLILGNHDELETKEYLKYFEKILGFKKFDGFVCTHFPMHPDSVTKKYKCDVHGHIHYNIVKDQNDIPDGRYFNICVEHLNYAPISLEELREQIKIWQEKYPPIYKSYEKNLD